MPEQRYIIEIITDIDATHTFNYEAQYLDCYACGTVGQFDKDLGLFTMSVAYREAESWASEHDPCEVRISKVGQKFVQETLARK